MQLSESTNIIKTETNGKNPEGQYFKNNWLIESPCPKLTFIWYILKPCRF